MGNCGDLRVKAPEAPRRCHLEPMRAIEFSTSKSYMRSKKLYAPSDWPNTRASPNGIVGVALTGRSSRFRSENLRQVNT